MPTPTRVRVRRVADATGLLGIAEDPGRQHQTTQTVRLRVLVQHAEQMSMPGFGVERQNPLRMLPLFDRDRRATYARCARRGARQSGDPGRRRSRQRSLPRVAHDSDSATRPRHKTQANRPQSIGSNASLRRSAFASASAGCRLSQTSCAGQPLSAAHAVPNSVRRSNSPPSRSLEAGSAAISSTPFVQMRDRLD